MSTNQEVYQYFYDLFELDLEEYEDYENVQEIIHNLMIFFKNPAKSCTCQIQKQEDKDTRTCFEKIGFKKFFQRHIQIINFDNDELDLFLKAQLLIMEIENKNYKEKIPQRINFRYCFNSTYSLCKTAFLKLYNISNHKFNNILDHLYNEGISKQIHGNTGRAPIFKTKVNIDENLKSIVNNFLNEYSLIHGLPSPMRHRNESGTFIYLSTDKNFKSVYNEFNEFYSKNILNDESVNDSEKIIHYRSFRRLWNELMPNLKFQPPASDLCDNCVQFKSKLQLAKRNIDEYDEIKAQFNEQFENLKENMAKILNAYLKEEQQEEKNN